MKRLVVLVLSGILLACASTNDTSKSGRSSSQQLSAQEVAYISQVEADGKLMYEKEIRATIASDLLLEQLNPSDFPNAVGWVTYPNVDDFTVSFYELIDEKYSVIADVIFSQSKDPEVVLKPSRQPHENEISMIEARLVAIENGVNGCSDRFNTIVMPSLNEDEWAVYVLAATNDPNLVRIGGHVKVMVSKSTSEMISRTKLSNSCLALNKTGHGFPDDSSVAALVVTHIVSSMPIAIHSYISLLHDINLAVGTESGQWMVSSGDIYLMKN